MATNTNLEIMKQDTTTYEITVKNSSGVALDITGATVYFTVKDDKTKADADAIIQKTATLTDPTNGKCEVALSSTDTNITAGLYYYDVQAKMSDGSIYTVLYGKFTVLQDVTQTT